MIYRCANAYYFRYLNIIGGIESHLYYIAKKYGKYDITVFYKDGDSYQVNRLKRYVKVVRIQDKDKIECDVIFCCFNREILDQVKAKIKYLVLHGDYKDMLNRGQIAKNQLPLDERIDRYIGVSQIACDSWKEITGIDCECVYEPVVLDQIEKPLMFISATRLTKEKGWERMVKLANYLDDNGVNYLWFIFTNSKDKKPTKNMIFCEPRLDITDKLEGFDGFIQLSDNEGYCLSVIEALKRKIPVIHTDLPVFRELGLNKDNSISIDLDMNKIPLKSIQNVLKMKINYKEPEDKWDDFLVHKKSDVIEKIYEVKATNEWKIRRITCIDLGYIPDQDEVWFVDENRLNEILNGEERKGVKLIDYRRA